jgi:hypothetical protein
LIRNSIIALALLAVGPGIAEGDQDNQMEHRAMGMSDDNMKAMHESTATLSAELNAMRSADSNDMKLRMMEKYINQNHRRIKMMMDAMEGNRTRRHDHQKTKK